MTETQKGKEALYLIDAYGLIYRSYFAFMSRPLRNAQGENVSALFGFARTLVNLLLEGAPLAGEDGRALDRPRRPAFLAAAFDSPTLTFRHKLYPEYKATRQKTPDDLHSQVPLVEEFLNALGVPLLRADGYEADDIIATLAAQCRSEGRQCYILSSDKDLLQLVGNGTYELRPIKGARLDAEGPGAAGLPYDLIGPREVRDEWGVPPERVLDLLSLTGDSSDNVPGVRGIGEKTAVKLMTRYGSLDGIYENIAGIEGSVGKKLAEGRESAFFSKSLIVLDQQVPLPISSLEALSVGELNRAAGAAVLLREGIRQSAFTLDPGSRARDKAGATLDADSKAGRTEAAQGAGIVRDRGAEQGAGIVRDQGADRQEAPREDAPADEALLGGGTYKTILDLNELKEILDAGKKQGLLVLDFETDSLDAWNSRPIGISLALEPKRAFYVPVAPHGVKQGEEKSGASVPPGSVPPGQYLDPEKVKALLIPLFADKTMTIAAHNAKYDYKVSRGWGIERWKCRIWDTMVAAWLADPERNNYSLDSLAASILDYTAIAYNSIIPKGCTFDVLDLETACRYSSEDADLTFRLKLYFEALLEKSGALALFRDLEMPLLPILAEMEGEGIRIDAKILRDYGVELGKALDDIQKETYLLAGREFNLASTKQLQEVLFVERKLKPGKKTKTGYSTDMAVLEELAREDPLPALLLRHRTLAKLKSTYVDTLAVQADREGRLHTNFVQTGTATGRLSSRDPNLQNIPIRDEEGRRIRSAFTAKKGHLLISADYSQIELVILAHLSGDTGLCSAFKEGKDVHARTAASIFGLKEKDVSPEQRRIAKTINFGVMYGMSAFRLANELGISRTDAAAFIQLYFKTYSGVRLFIDKLIARTEETGYASTIMGRRRYIPAINSRNKTEKAAAERVAVNTPIQGSAADIVKTAMLYLDHALTAEKSSARLLLQVHDELILEVPASDADAAAALVKREMEKAAVLSVPLRVSVETGKRWGDFH
ncbi:MAG: DNA polymerase I [Spirochaetaceae bacterium]|jgi:DNA polymerase-1|nr:DNA polymerase I [Spirochaetaceae bacterium]